jgi:hypothetical protein
MSQNLVRDAFTEAHWDEVQAFDCGSMPWELEVSDWLKRPIGTTGGMVIFVAMWKVPRPSGRPRGTCSRRRVHGPIHRTAIFVPFTSGKGLD